jgi:hypothetical protein
MGALLIAPESQIHLESFDLQAIQPFVAHIGDLFFKFVHPAPPMSLISSLTRLKPTERINTVISIFFFLVLSTKYILF